MTRTRLMLICLLPDATQISLGQQADTGARRVSSPDGSITFLLSGALPVVDETGVFAAKNPVESSMF